VSTYNRIVILVGHHKEIGNRRIPTMEVCKDIAAWPSTTSLYSLVDGAPKLTILKKNIDSV